MKKINTRDLLFYILERIVFVLLLGIIGATVLGLKYYRDYDKIAEVSDTSKEKIEKVYSMREAYDEFISAKETSGILEIDPRNYYFARVTYRLSDISLGSSIYDKILEDINDNSFREELAEKSNFALDSISLEYLVNVWKQDVDDSTLYYFDLKTDNKDDAEIIISNADKMIEEVGLKYINREKEGGWTKENFSVSNFSEPSFVINSQESFSETLEQIQSKMDDAEATLSNSERIYYEKNYLGKEVSFNKKTLIKKILIGFIAGAALMIGFIMFIYMYDGKIKSAEEIKVLFGLSLIAVVDDKEKDTKHKHGLIRRLRYRFDSREYAREVLELLKGKTVVLFDNFDKEELSVVNEITSNVPKSNYLHLDAKEQEKCKEFESAILVIRLGSMKYRELERELEVCSMCNVKIHGVIALV